jgi:hypothetical protein
VAGTLTAWGGPQATGDGADCHAVLGATAVTTLNTRPSL